MQQKEQEKLILRAATEIRRGWLRRMARPDGTLSIREFASVDAVIRSTGCVAMIVKLADLFDGIELLQSKARTLASTLTQLGLRPNGREMNVVADSPIDKMIASELKDNEGKSAASLASTLKPIAV